MSITAEVREAYRRARAPIAHDEAFPDDPESLPEGCEVDGASARRPVDEAYDFVVIGSGAAGATSAVVLAEAGYSVAIVEEGAWVRTRSFGSALYPALKNLFRGMATPVMFGKSFVPILQGRCVGGSTTVNSAIAWRAPERVFADWQARFGLGPAVGMDALAPHYAAIERELSVRAISDDALGEANALFGVAAEKLGMESHRIQRYDGGCEGSAGCLTGCRGGRKLGMNITYVPRALHAGARVFTSSRVEHVEIRGGRAVAVVATMKGAGGSGVPLRLRARRGVFVAASTVQSPNVLRRSGVRARALGKHFQAHPGVSLAATFDRPVHMDYGAAQGYNSLALLESDRIKLESLALPPELVTSRLPGFGPELMHRLADGSKVLAWCAVIRAEAEGTVRELFGEDRVDYTLAPADVARARKGLRVLTEMMFAAGAREVYPGVHGMPTALRSPDELALFDDASLDPRAYNFIASHLFGAARMGPDPRASVVGTDFQCHDAAGLYVVDSSVFPTNLGVNPQHTIMAMSRLAATGVAARPLPAI